MKKKTIVLMLLFTISTSCIYIKNWRSTVPTITNGVAILPSPQPTIGFELQEQFYEELKSNGGCEFPCFLGITPGKTSDRDAVEILRPYSQYQVVNYQIDGTPVRNAQAISIDTTEDINLSLSISLIYSNDVVQGAMVDFNSPTSYDKERNTISVDESDKHLQRYGILELFERQGIPDEIYLDPTRTHQTQGAYGIDVIYNNLKIMAIYPGTAKIAKNGKYQLCPDIGNGDVTGFIFSVAAPTTNDMVEFFYSNRMSGFTPSVVSEYRSTSQKLDAKAIYDVFIKKGQSCFYEDEYWVK